MWNQVLPRVGGAAGARRRNVVAADRAERKDVVRVVIVVQGEAELLEVVLAGAAPRGLAGLLHGRQAASAIRIAMIAITTSSSIRVNPRRGGRRPADGTAHDGRERHGQAPADGKADERRQDSSRDRPECRPASIRRYTMPDAGNDRRKPDPGAAFSLTDRAVVPAKPSSDMCSLPGKQEKAHWYAIRSPNRPVARQSLTRRKLALTRRSIWH